MLLLLTVWFSVLGFAALYLYAHYNLKVVTTPPWWAQVLGQLPYGALLSAAKTFSALEG